MTYNNHQYNPQYRNYSEWRRSNTYNPPHHNNELITGNDRLNSNQSLSNFGQHAAYSNDFGYYNMNQPPDDYRHPYSYQNMRVQPMHRTVSESHHFHPQHHQFPQHSVSFDTYTDEHYYQQQTRYACITSAVKRAKQDLANVEHKMLAKEDELYKLLKIQRNPSEQDVQALRSEITELEREIQQMCNQMDKNSMESSHNSQPTQQAPPPQESAQTREQRRYDEFFDLNRPRRLTQSRMALESPTTRLLMDPIDNSLVFSHNEM
jgi:hypothetical protein